jgi:hypothetical protein
MDSTTTDDTAGIWQWRCRARPCKQTVYASDSGGLCRYHLKVQAGLIEATRFEKTARPAE